MAIEIPKTCIRFQNACGDPLYVASVSFKDGVNNGYAVKSVTFTRNLEKATRFRTEVAEAIVKQYFTKVVATVTPDGALIKDYCAELRPIAEAYFRNRREIVETFNNALRDAIRASDPELLSFITGGR